MPDYHPITLWRCHCDQLLMADGAGKPRGIVCQKCGCEDWTFFAPGMAAVIQLDMTHIQRAMSAQLN